MARNNRGPVINYNRVAELTGLGWGANRIAAEIGCSSRQVTRIRVHLKINKPVPETAGRPISPERLEAMRKLVDAGASIGEIVRTLHCHHDTVSKYFPEAKQSGDDWRHLWGQIRNDPKMRRLFDEMGGIA